MRDREHRRAERQARPQHHVPLERERAFERAIDRRRGPMEVVGATARRALGEPHGREMIGNSAVLK
jgi:hypothetical protein